MRQAPIDPDTLTFKHAFDSDTEVQKYQKLSLALFALSLYLRFEDLDEFAANAITEGPDDKKVDICHIDEEDGRAIIGQSYYATTWNRRSAPANKAQRPKQRRGMASVSRSRPCT